MKQKKAEPEERQRKYEKPISFYPLKWWAVIEAFMKVNPKKIKKGK